MRIKEKKDYRGCNNPLVLLFCCSFLEGEQKFQKYKIPEENGRAAALYCIEGQRKLCCY